MPVSIIEYIEIIVEGDPDPVPVRVTTLPPAPTELNVAAGVLVNVDPLPEGGDNGDALVRVAGEPEWVPLTSDMVGDANTPDNYTPADPTVEGHLSGIDDALASAGTTQPVASVILYCPDRTAGSLTPADGETIHFVWYQPGHVGAGDGGAELDDYATMNTFTWGGAWASNNDPTSVFLMFPGDEWPTVYADVTLSGFEARTVLGGRLVGLGCGGGPLGVHSAWIASNSGADNEGGSIDPTQPATSFQPTGVTAREVAVGSWMTLDDWLATFGAVEQILAANGAPDDDTTHLLCDTASGSFAVDLSLAARDMRVLNVINTGTNVVTLTGTISGLTDPTIPAREARTVYFDTDGTMSFQSARTIGGSGAVTSVDGDTGDVDLSGTYEPLGAVGDLIASLGTAAMADTGDFDPAGAAADALADAQTYADQIIAAANAMVFKGVIDCSANPNYPAADAGHMYVVSVAGKIGGASGPNVEVGDRLLCLTDGTLAGTSGAVGANWSIGQVNIDGAVTGPVSSTDGHVVLFDGVSGRLVKSGGALGTAAFTAAAAYATAAQGALADTAVQPADLADVATSGDYTDLDNLPTLGTAAAQNVGAFDAAGTATAAVAAHAGAADPHADRAFTTSAISTHAGASDPHGDRAYAAALFAANDVLLYKGALDCSANPNYPAADAGHAYKVSVAGKIGGASGVNVEVGDLLVCTVDSSASGNHATVGANWDVIQVNLDGAVIGPTSATNDRVALFDGSSGRLIKDGGVLLSALLTAATAASTYQPVDADLTAVAALSPANDDVLQRKAGAWTNRTLAQLKADLGQPWSLISDTTVTGAAASSVSVNCSGYSRLRLQVIGRSTSTAGGTAGLSLRFNSDSTSTYSTAGGAVTGSISTTFTASQTNTDRQGEAIFEIAVGVSKWTNVAFHVAYVSSVASISAGGANHAAWSGSIGAALASLQVFFGAGDIAIGSRIIVEGIV